MTICMLTSLHNNVPFILSVFMTNKTLSGAKNNHRSIEPEGGKTPMFSFTAISMGEAS